MAPDGLRDLTSDGRGMARTHTHSYPIEKKTSRGNRFRLKRFDHTTLDLSFHPWILPKRRAKLRLAYAGRKEEGEKEKDGERERERVEEKEITKVMEAQAHRTVEKVQME